MKELSDYEIRRNGLFNRTLVTVNDPYYWKLNNGKGYGYNFKNGMRHYGFEVDEWYCSEESKQELIKRGHDFSIPKTQSYYDNMMDENGKKLFTPEHVIPVNVTKNLIKAHLDKHGFPMSESTLRDILDHGSKICLVVKSTEDKRLGGKLQSYLPEGCDPYENPFGRYDEGNVKISDKKLKIL